MNGARIGTGCIVAAGAVVMEKFNAPPYSLIVGAPATVKRHYTDKKACLERAGKQARQYSARADAYRKSLQELVDPDLVPDGAWGDNLAYEEGGLPLSPSDDRPPGGRMGILVAAVAGAAASVLMGLVRSRLWRMR